METSLTRNPSKPNPSRKCENNPPEPAVPAELEKILASAEFREAEGLRRFLRYTVEHTLRGEGDQLKEYRLGIDVFDRDSSFDPRLDPVVRMAARRLRAKLIEYYKKEGANDSICIDVPKGGYAAAFTSNAPSPVLAAKEPAQSRRSWLLLLSVCLLFATAIMVTRWFSAARPITPASQPEESSIAVLPFLNLTRDHDDEYLTDGLSDELTGALSKLSGLRVIARTSAFRFKGKTEDVRSIGSQLSVASLLEGSLQRSGEQLRITVQLIRTSDGSHIWAETYTRNTSNSFALEDEITQAVSHALRVRLAGQAGLRTRAVNPEAHDLYLRGRYWWNRRTPVAVWKSITYFNQALEKDPVYPEAYLGLADAYTVLGFNDQAAANEVVPKARKAAEQALQLDDSLSEAHADLAAALLYHQWNLQGAELEFQRAISLNPNYATGQQWYGLLLMCQRKFGQALDKFTRAQRLDPLSPMIALDIGQVHYYSGEYDAAIEQSQKVLAEDPEFAMAHDLLGMAYERQRRFPEALREFQRYLELSGRDPDALMRLAITHADSRERKQALDLAREIEDVPKGHYISAYDISTVYAALGDRELAFVWLRRAIDEHSASCLMLYIDPAFNSLRSDPRFLEDARRVGLITHS